MKRLYGVILAGFAMVLWSSCTKEILVTPLPAPQNLQISGSTNNGVGIILTWDHVADAYSYNVYYYDSLLGNTVSTQFTVDSLIGLFTVAAVDQDGNEGDRAQPVSNFAVTGSGTLYERSDTQSGHNTAFYWTSDGMGQDVPLGDSTYWPIIDLYIDDFTAGTVVPTLIHFVSPTYDRFDPQGLGFNADTTWLGGPQLQPSDWFPSPITLQEFIPDDDPANPANGINPGEYYFAEVPINGAVHYVMIKVTNVSSDGKVDFAYWFQPIPGFRGLKAQ